MKKLASFVLGACLVGSANAAIFGFAAPMINGAQELVPTNSTAYGSGSFTLDDSTWTITGSISLVNAANKVFTGYHVHLAPTVTPRSNGPVVFDIKDNVLFDNTIGNNRFIGFSGVLNGTQAQRMNILQGWIEERGYFNFHTTAFPGGEIRGDIHCTSVPEPATFTAMGLGAVAMLRKRRK